jgi:hypothetical protein
VGDEEETLAVIDAACGPAVGARFGVGDLVDERLGLFGRQLIWMG